MKACPFCELRNRALSIAAGGLTVAGLLYLFLVEYFKVSWLQDFVYGTRQFTTPILAAR